MEIGVEVGVDVWLVDVAFAGLVVFVAEVVVVVVWVADVVFAGFVVFVTAVDVFVVVGAGVVVVVITAEFA